MFDDNDEVEFIVLSSPTLKSNAHAIVVETYREPLDINLHLDMYNDYITLYKMFGDQVYLQSAEGVMRKLRYFGVGMDDTGRISVNRMAQ